MPTATTNLGTQKTMTSMFAMQELLMKEYQKIEDFPEWPLDIEVRANQKLLKGFALRFLEEISESFNDLILVMQNAQSNKQDNAHQHAKNFNEEIGDATCFLLELMIFSGVDEEYLKRWITDKEPEPPGYGFGGLLKPEDVLASFYKLAHFNNAKEDYVADPQNMFEVTPMVEIYNSENFEWMGLRRISEKFADKVTQLLWWVTHLMMQALAALKNKEWSQTDRVSNTLVYKQGLVEVFRVFIQVMQYVDKNERSLYNSHYLTYLKNMKRIKSGY